jgi:molybdopterin converting factor small subunit
MSRPTVTHPQDSTVARTIRFPATLREKTTADAERCGRSFGGQVVALLRRHYGEDAEIAPSPAEILALAADSLAEIPDTERHSLTQKLQEPESRADGRINIANSNRSRN